MRPHLFAPARFGKDQTTAFNLLGISVTHHEEDEQAVIAIHGPFTLGLQSRFSEALSSVRDGVTEIVIDLTATEHVDASAMGMLLSLRLRHPSASKVIMLAPGSRLADTFRTANFDRLFAIETGV